MAHTNATTYYSLPQFLNTDKPAWLTDVNPAYEAIDTGMHAAKAAADAAQDDATLALSTASTAGTTATGADAKATGSLASISDAFDATSTYEVGDIVIYNSLLYKCTVAVTTPGAWTGTDNWTRTTIEEVINTNSIKHYTTTYELAELTLSTSHYGFYEVDLSGAPAAITNTNIVNVMFKTDAVAAMYGTVITFYAYNATTKKLYLGYSSLNGHRDITGTIDIAYV